MRCAVDGDVIPAGDEYYKIDGQPVCIDHVYRFLNDWYMVHRGVWKVEGETIGEEDLNEFLRLHLEICDEEEEEYNPFDEPEYRRK